MLRTSLERTGATLLPLVFVLTATCLAQVKPHAVDLGRQYPNQPFKVLGCELDQRFYADCRGMQSNDDWLGRVRVRLKNVSGKAISEYEVDLWLDKQGDMDLPTATPLVAASPALSADRRSQTLEPDQIVSLSMQYPAELHEVGTRDTARLVQTFAYFTDGTQWLLGEVSAIPSGQIDDPTRKLVKYVQRFRDEPIAVTSVRAGGIDSSVGTPFATTEQDWLKDLGVTFRNKTDKAITCVIFSVMVFEGHPTRSPSGFTIAFGCPSISKSTRNEHKVLIPGETGTAVIDRRTFEGFKTSIAGRESLGERTTIELIISEVWFADGTRMPFP